MNYVYIYRLQDQDSGYVLIRIDVIQIEKVIELVILVKLLIRYERIMKMIAI